MKTINRINWRNIIFLLKHEFQATLPSLKKGMLGLLILYIFLYIFSVVREDPQFFTHQVNLYSLIIIGRLLVRRTNESLFTKGKTYSDLMLPSSNAEKVVSKAIITFLFAMLFLPLFTFLFTLFAGIISEATLHLAINVFNPFRYEYLLFINVFLCAVPFLLLIITYCKKYSLGRILVFTGLAFFTILIIWYTNEFFTFQFHPYDAHPIFISIVQFFKQHPGVYNFFTYYQWLVSVPVLWVLYYKEFKKMEA
ncbi:MAG: hypothetical protein PHX86_08090 [Caldisericia bacterium]|nr:hypothetical protein [Caldisericia bacterium]